MILNSALFPKLYPNPFLGVGFIKKSSSLMDLMPSNSLPLLSADATYSPHGSEKIFMRYFRVLRLVKWYSECIFGYLTLLLAGPSFTIFLP